MILRLACWLLERVVRALVQRSELLDGYRAQCTLVYRDDEGWGWVVLLDGEGRSKAAAKTLDAALRTLRAARWWAL